MERIMSAILSHYCHVKSRTSDNRYIVSVFQDGTAQCSCLGWKNCKTCWHCDEALKEKATMNDMTELLTRNAAQQVVLAANTAIAKMGWSLCSDELKSVPVQEPQASAPRGSKRWKHNCSCGKGASMHGHCRACWNKVKKEANSAVLDSDFPILKEII